MLNTMYLDCFLALYPYTVWYLGNNGNNNNVSVTVITGKQYNCVWERKTNLGYVTFRVFKTAHSAEQRYVCTLHLHIIAETTGIFLHSDIITLHSCYRAS